MTPLSEARWDDLLAYVYAASAEAGQAAAVEAAAVIRGAIAARGAANVILATGNSQLTFLAALREQPEVSWPQVNVFHMDEYLGLSPDHPASFPRFLRRRFLDGLTVHAFFPLDAQAGPPESVCAEYARLLRAHPADLCALGIGENGHLAFNDPPFAEFTDPCWVKVIRLAEASRHQQVGEGHFSDLADVPTHAITLTIPVLLAARRVLAIAPEARKALAVARALRGPVSEDCPASVLRRASHAHLFLDRESAAGLAERA
ncbi:MAG: 6-phosphogluconolactonase [Anaerolineales bacterium]|nr:6-phosphogluconolactonase [Anaerolineales bacterium]